MSNPFNSMEIDHNSPVGKARFSDGAKCVPNADGRKVHLRTTPDMR